jgi:homoserine kinase
LTAVVVHPDLEIETARARALLGDTVRLADAIRGRRISARSFTAFIARTSRSSRARSKTPSRSRAAPRSFRGRTAIKRAAVEAGALGCSLSGSGPSLFALCGDVKAAAAVAAAMTDAVRAEIGGDPQTYISPIAPQGARIVSACAS